MKPLLAPLIAIGALLYCGSIASLPAETLPAGVIRKGSLANGKLISDASVAAVGKLAAMGYTVDPHRVSFQYYVVAMPEGTPGHRKWTERWYYSASGKQIPITIDFSEAGLGAADYVIRKK